MRRLLLLILTIGICAATYPQDVTVEARLDSSLIFIGDRAQYSIKVTQPDDIRLIMPEYRDTLISNIEILSQTEVDTTYKSDGYLILNKTYNITSFDTGFYQIPPYYLEYVTPNGKKRFYSDYQPLQVRRVDITPPDSTDVIFDIKGPEKVGYSAGEILPWVLLAVVIAVAAWFLYRYLQRRSKKKEPEGPKMPDEPIHIISFRELDKLEKKRLWQAGKIKEYYSRLTEIIRYYLEIRYGIRALEMTSEEIIEGLAGKDINEGDMVLLRSILRNADLSKFARYTHDAESNTEALSNARSFVSNTYRTAEGRDKDAGNEDAAEDRDKDAGKNGAAEDRDKDAGRKDVTEDRKDNGDE
ncbi:MAG: hypothetical protein U5K32_05350 [Bacteroidales bacterium]|nr:hypothetical protein [Bacteroidales bacterium]